MMHPTETTSTREAPVPSARPREEGSSPARPASARRPPGPPGVYGVRNLVDFMRDQLGRIRALADTYGDVVEMKFLGKTFFVLNHPDDIEAALVKHAHKMKRDDYAEVLERVLGKGLLTSDGELWKRQRKLMSQAFVPRRIQAYADAMVRVTDAALRPLRDGDTINLHREISRVTMEVVADVLFGAGMSPEDVRTVGDSMEVVNEYMANSPEALLKLPGWVPTPRNLATTRAIERIDELIYRIIANRRAAPPRDDLLGTLLAAQDEDGTRMTDRQLRDEAITLFLAGHETTALTLAHTLYLLSKHPDVERKVHAEVASVLGDRLPTSEDVRALRYVDRVLKESMRLYPPAWATGREVADDVEIGGYVIPKGAQIMASQWVVHRDPRWFPNPEGFDPDRWSPERAQGLPRYAYFPFGGGPRVCIGNHFAMMEATLVLAMIVQRFRVDLLAGQRLSLRPSVTLRQAGPGLSVRLRARSGAA
ncbi:MAG: cytochrome P450 [Polyangiaceae bacterium]